MFLSYIIGQCIEGKVEKYLLVVISGFYKWVIDGYNNNREFAKCGACNSETQ